MDTYDLFLPQKATKQDNDSLESTPLFSSDVSWKTLDARVSPMLKEEEDRIHNVQLPFSVFA